MSLRSAFAAVAVLAVVAVATAVDDAPARRCGGVKLGKSCTRVLTPPTPAVEGVPAACRSRVFTLRAWAVADEPAQGRVAVRLDDAVIARGEGVVRARVRCSDLLPGVHRISVKGWRGTSHRSIHRDFTVLAP